MTAATDTEAEVLTPEQAELCARVAERPFPERARVLRAWLAQQSDAIDKHDQSQVETISACILRVADLVTQAAAAGEATRRREQATSGRRGETKAARKLPYRDD